MENNLPKRKSIRLKEYDYSSAGMYFVTICIKNRIEILGKIKDDKMNLTKEGIIVEKHIRNITNVFKKITIDEYIIMPNHIHMIIAIDKQNKVTLSKIIKRYKENITKEIRYCIWQKSFYEHIIRDENEYYKIKEYIQNNVINWEKDIYF